MNKKLFILMFLIMASPVFAEEMPKVDYVEEKAPTLEEVQVDTGVENKTTFTQKVKNLFKKEQKVDIEKAEDIAAVELPKEVLKEQKKQEKLAQKEAKKAQKEAEKAQKLAEKEAKKAEKQAKNIVQEETVIEENAEEQPTDVQQTTVEINKIIQVDDCVKLALEHHPLIKSAMSNTEIYKSRIAQAWANYFPTLSAGISYTKTDLQMTYHAAGAMQRYDMYYVPNVSGNMLLFDFGKTKAQADLAKRTYESSTFYLQNSINNVIFGVKQAYYNLLFAQQQVEVYTNTVADYKLHLEQATAYYNIGTKPKIDVLTAEHNLGRAELNLIKAKNTLNIAYVQLSNAMGLPDYTDYDVIDNLTTKAYSITAEEAINTAFETSPELLAMKKKADASGLLVRASRRAFTPNISGFAGYTRGGKKIDLDTGYQIGAQLTYSNVNLLLLKKQVDEAKATHKKDVADYENSKQNLHFSVKEAYLNLVTAQESIVVAKLAMDQAQEQYDQASGRYKVGLGNAIELKDAETTYRNAQLDYYNNLLNYHVSAANLERLMGSPLSSSDADLL